MKQKFKFIGEYTGGSKSISYPPYTFHERKPTVVDLDTDMGRRISRNQEFEEVGKPAE